MPDLFHSLLKQDIGHLRIIAELWGIELDSTTAEGALEELCASLLDPNLLAEIRASLPPEADSALTALAHAGGRLPWQTFTRRYGGIREVGAGKRDREKPYLNPASAAEVLYYRGLLARAFFDTQKGPQEFAYIPDDLLELMDKGMNEERGKEEEAADSVSEPLGRPASPGERGRDLPAGDSLLDDAVTLLAALRLGMEPPPTTIPHAILQAFLQAAHILSDKGTPQPEAVKQFLEAPRPQALQRLQEAWQSSETFNELKLMPGIVCEGEWSNQPLETREFLLNLLGEIPQGKWWSLNAFLRGIKQNYADFQRPAGDYDSWFIKRAADGVYLRGFAHWDEVDGALVKFFITGILHWLGEVDLSIAEGATEPTAFRVRSNVPSQRSDIRPSTLDETGKIKVLSNGRIAVERTAPRVVRYQISRFCEWEEDGRAAKRTETTQGEYKYRITVRSLAKAKEQGLKAEHLLVLLSKHAEAGIPPSLVKALKRWEVHGVEARVETQVVLRVSRSQVLEEMRKSKAAKFLGEVLSPTAVIVKSGAIQKVMEAMAELGMLLDDLTEEK
ncbi:MAG: helicase-associated domain-containing protein [Chloroflexota bacterium]